MQTEILTSVRLQPMINIKRLGSEPWSVILRFGRKGDSDFRFPIIFKSRKPAEKLYNELLNLKGKTFNEMKQVADEIYNRYSKFNYTK